MLYPRNIVIQYGSAQRIRYNWVRHIEVLLYVGRDEFPLVMRLLSLQTEAALAIDALSVIIESLRMTLDSNSKMMQNTFRRGQIYYNETAGIQCRTAVPSSLDLGPDIIRRLRQVGHLEFYEQTDKIYYCKEMSLRFLIAAIINTTLRTDYIERLSGLCEHFFNSKLRRWLINELKE